MVTVVESLSFAVLACLDRNTYAIEINQNKSFFGDKTNLLMEWNLYLLQDF